MTAITTSPPKPPEPEITVGPWDIADWRVSEFARPPERGWTSWTAVAVLAVHRDTGETRCNGVRLPGQTTDEDEARRVRIARAKDVLRLWVDDLNAAEREDQIA